MKMIVDENAFSNQPAASENIEAQDSSTSESDDSDSELRKTKIGATLSTPAVRNFAKQLGVNIEDVLGTGEEGRVLKDDIVNFATRQGILKESSASLSASSHEQLIEGDQKFQEVSYASGLEYEDTTMPLRYIVT